MELRIYFSLIGLMFTLESFPCSPAPKCPRSMNAYNTSESIPNMAVLGGTEDTKRKYNYMVRIGSFDQPDCAGVLVTELWVVTTGHCVDIVQDKSDYKVFGGGTFGVDEQERDIVASFSTNDDPGYSIHNKLGLVKLNAKFDKGVGYANIANTGWPANKKARCTYVGYGRKRDGSDFVTSRKAYYIEMEFGRDKISCGCRDDVDDDICLKNVKDKGPCRCNGGSITCDGVVVGLNRFIGPPTGECGDGSGKLGDERCGNEDFNIFFTNIGNYHNWLVTNSNGDIGGRTTAPATTTTTTTTHTTPRTTTKKGGRGGGGGGKSDSLINKSNNYMQTMFIVYLLIDCLKSDFN